MYWWDYFIALAKDKVPAVRLLFLRSLPHVKTYFVADLDMHHAVMTEVENLKFSMESDIAELASKIDLELLQVKKLNIELIEKEKAKFEKELHRREQMIEENR